MEQRLCKFTCLRAVDCLMTGTRIEQRLCKVTLSKQ